MTGTALTFPTPASLGNLDQYIQAVNRFPLLTPEQELSLGRASSATTTLTRRSSSSCRTCGSSSPSAGSTWATASLRPTSSRKAISGS